MRYRGRLYDLITLLYRHIRLSAILLSFLLPVRLLAQNNIDPSETVVYRLFINGQSWGEITALCDLEDRYIDLAEVLDRLEYTYELQPQICQFKGFTSANGDHYIVDHQQLSISSDSTSLPAHVVWSSDGHLFVRSDYLYQLYNIQPRFTAGSLSVNLITTQSIPALLRRQREARKERMLREKEENSLTNIDTVRRRNFRVNGIGYSIAPSFSSGNGTNWGLRTNLNGELLKGSFLVNYNYSSLDNRPWNDNFTFAWTRPLSDKEWIRSVGVYHDYSNLVTSMRGYATTLTLSNERQNSYLGRDYAYQGKTTPNTEVEIYNNGTLIQYVQSDSLGHYRVEIPTFGGDNKIVAVSYDSFGLPVSSEELIYLPPNMQSKGRFGYRFSVGYTDDGSFFIAPMAVYGATRFLTLAAGNETVFRPDRNTSILLLGLKIAASKRVRIDLDYIPTVKFNTTLSANIAHRLNGNVTYERFENGQTVVRYAPKQRLMVGFNGDLPFKWLRGNYYLSAQYYQFPFGESFSSYLGVYFWWKRILTNLSVSTASDCIELRNFAYALRAGYNFTPRLYNEFAAEYRSMNSDFLVRNRTNYQFKNQLVASLEAEYSFGYKRYMVSLGVTWKLPWAQLKSGVTNARHYTSGYVGATGSVIFQEHGVAFSDRYVAGSSLLVALYVDMNGNEGYDQGEPLFKEANVLVHAAGEQQRTGKGVLFTNIPANRAFKVVIPNQSFPDITWQIRPQQINLLFSASQSRSLYIPIRVVSEISGRIYTIRNGHKIGVGDIPVTITEIKSGAIVTTNTDQWGSYNYMGLVCGTYTITIADATLGARRLKKEGSDLAPVSFAPALEGEQIDLPDIVLGVVDNARPQ